MIKANRENIQIDGMASQICAELSGIVKAVYETLAEKYDDDFARKTIARVGRVAFMSEKELDKAVEEKIKELEKLVKEL